MRKSMLLTTILCLAVGLGAAETPQVTAFNRLRDLSGDWEGTFAWSGGRNATGKMNAQYQTTGNGSAMVENLFMDGTLMMTSVYHLDGSDLRVTHYCAAQNQPRLRASSIDPDGGQITFSFVDITNLRSPDAGHVHGLEVRLLDRDHITLRFHFKTGDKDSDELVDLKRKK